MDYKSLVRVSRLKVWGEQIADIVVGRKVRVKPSAFALGKAEKTFAGLTKIRENSEASLHRRWDETWPTDNKLTFLS